MAFRNARDHDQLLRAIMDRSDSFLVGAMSAAIETAARFDAVADDFAPTMLAFGRQRVYGALEAVKVMRDAIYKDFDRLIIFISANFTSVHKKLLFQETPPEQG